jgi:prepilin-type N-terminal cleavage/methylation domain-containing protein
VRARTNDQGFTLLELSIVLFIIAIVTGMAIQSGVSVVATARLSATQQKMKAIDKALLAYRNATDRLPCPGDLTIAPGATNYGVEGATPGFCTGGTPTPNFRRWLANATYLVEGAVPVTTLGLPNDFMYDGWGNHFNYAVIAPLTALRAFVLTHPPLICTSVTVNDVNGKVRSDGAIYALISHGPNGHGAYSKNGTLVSTGSVNANELTNCHCNSSGTQQTYSATYVQADPSSDPSNSLNSFDDIVMYREYWQTQTPDYPLPMPMNYTMYLSEKLKVPQIFSLMGASITEGYTHIGSIGTYGSTDSGKLNGSNTVAIDAQGNFWVTGTFHVEEFSPSGSYIGQFGSGGNVNGTGNGQFDGPWAIAIDSSGNIWVTDKGNNRVQEFSSSGGWVQTIPSSGCGGSIPACPASSTNGQFSAPMGIAFDSGGNLWVGDSGNNRLQEFNSSGSYVNAIGAGYNGIAGAIGSSGLGSGQFNQPEGIAIDSTNNIWVADYGNNRVQELNSSGSFLNGIGSGYEGVPGSIGTPGAGTGMFTNPVSVAVISGGIVFVIDRYMLQVFNSSLRPACHVYDDAYIYIWGDGGFGVTVTSR